MNRNIKNSKMIFLLLCLSLLLWSKIFLILREELQSNSKELRSIPIKPNTFKGKLELPNIKINILDSLRKLTDPFLFSSKSTTVLNGSKNFVSQESDDSTKIPGFKYKGSLADRNGIVALIEVPPSEIHLVREGQILNSYRVIKILQDQIIIKNKREEFAITINQ